MLFGAWSASYDQEDRLRSIVNAGSETQEAAKHGPSADLVTAVTMDYRPDGLRADKTTSSGTTYYVYAGGQLLMELDGSGNVTATSTFGPWGLVSRRVGSTSTFYTFDDRGNTVQRLDSSGNIIDSHASDEYGSQWTTGSGTSDPYIGFGAQYGYFFDKDLGLSLLGHRFYDSANGRFINQDPIGMTGGINLYSYTGNGPLSGADPGGLRPGLNGMPIDAYIDWAREDDKEALVWAMAGSQFPGPGLHDHEPIADSCPGAMDMFDTGPEPVRILRGSEGDLPIRADYPPNGGGWSWSETIVAPGEIIGRRGSPQGRYANPFGEPGERLSLPQDKWDVVEEAYRVVRPIHLETSRVIPWYDQIGCGKQFRFYEPLDVYLKSGDLEHLPGYSAGK